MSESEATILAAIGAVFMGALISLFTYIVKKLSTHDIALALILQQLYPKGPQNSLSTVLDEIKTDIESIDKEKS